MKNKINKNIYIICCCFIILYFLFFIVSLNINYFYNRETLSLSNFKNGTIIPKNASIYIGDDYYAGEGESYNDIVNIAYCYDLSCVSDYKFTYVDNVKQNSKYELLDFSSIFDYETDSFVGYGVELFDSLGISFIFYPIFTYSNSLICKNGNIKEVNWYLYDDDVSIIANNKKIKMKNGIYKIPMNEKIKFDYDGNYEYIKFDVRSYNISIDTDIKELNNFFLDTSTFNAFTPIKSLELHNDMYFKLKSNTKNSYMDVKNILLLNKYNKDYTIHNGDNIYYEIICENDDIKNGTLMYDPVFGTLNETIEKENKLHKNYNEIFVYVIDVLGIISLVLLLWLLRRVKKSYE